MYGVLQSRTVPIEEAPPLTARMDVASHTIENHRPLRARIELRIAPITTAGLVNILPDPEDFVDYVACVDLEFVICVSPGDEDFEIVLFVDPGIAPGESCPDIRLFGGKTEVKMGIVPEKPDACIEPGGLARHDVDERIRDGSDRPAWLIQAAIDVDRRIRSVASVSGNINICIH